MEEYLGFRTFVEKAQQVGEKDTTKVVAQVKVDFENFACDLNAIAGCHLGDLEVARYCSWTIETGGWCGVLCALDGKTERLHRSA